MQVAEDVAGDVDFPVEGEGIGGEHSDVMMRCVGNQEMTVGNPIASSVGLKENLIMENLEIGGVCETSIVLTTCVNGQKERVKFLNCKTVNVNVEEGKIIYNPAHAFHFDTTPSPLNPNLEPTTIQHQPISSPLPSAVPNTPTSSPASPPQPSLPFQPDPLFFAQANLLSTPPSPATHSPSPYVGAPCPRFNPLGDELIVSPSPSAEVYEAYGGDKNMSKLALVVDLTSYQGGGSHTNIESQPIALLSYESEDSSGADSPSNEEEEDYSNLVVENDNNIWADKAKSKEEKIWKMAKDVGVSGAGIDEFYIQ